MEIDAGTITAFFTGIGGLLALIFKQHLELRKLKRPSEPTNLENERKICDERVSALESENDALRAMLDQGCDLPFCTVGMDGIVTHCNAALAGVAGLGGADDIIGFQATELMGFEEREVFEMAWVAAMMEGAAVADGIWGMRLFMEAGGSGVTVKAFK